jgi:hypothetical protein
MLGGKRACYDDRTHRSYSDKGVKFWREGAERSRLGRLGTGSG